jgi:hypothetical protein
MFEAVRSRVLRVFRVPHDPDPPAGAPGSIRVFRAGRNFYKLRLARWGIGQVGALAGIIVSLILLDRFEWEIESSRYEVKQSIATPASAPSPTQAQAQAPAPGGSDPNAATPAARKKTRKKSPEEQARTLVRRVAGQWPPWLFGALYLLEWFGIMIYLAQIPITYAMARLDYELRWYIVTDRSLRIRAGLAAVQETTMSFANVQQVVVTQGPLQRLLGLADVRVQSAGGGGDRHDEHGRGDSLHTGVFHGVENASEIRDLIQERLRAFRQAGLGDPDDAHAEEAVPPASSPPQDARSTSALAAARELLQEARRLRETFR